jgi:hypothetical protein
MNIHLVLYSNNEPFETTKRLIVDSISQYSNNNVFIHHYNLEKIKQIEWFSNISNLPYIFNHGRRDGYYNSWKAFIIKDVYNKINENDILYYVDCSQHYQDGFLENIDKLCELAMKKLCIAGSVGDDIQNNSFGCCDNILVWNKIIPNKDNSIHLNKNHVLNSWFLFKKCESNEAFINDWTKFTIYSDNEFEYPLVTYHHTVDQSIFNILVYKYDLPVFYSKNIGHNENKNKNIVLNIVNNSFNADEYLVHL